MKQEEAAAIMGERMGDRHALDLVAENLQWEYAAQVKPEGRRKSHRTLLSGRCSI